MNIAIIRCSANLNIGNNFINAGGEYLIQKLFPHAHIFTFEFYDSSIKINYENPSPVLLKHELDFISQECDMAFVLCGCILSKYTRDVLFEIAKLKTKKKILIGAGAYQYDDFDRWLCREIAKKYDLIFTRDNTTLDFFCGAKNAFSGIDMAFFAKDAIDNTGKTGDYAVINLDLLEDNYENIERERKELKWKYRSIYITENTASRHDYKGYLYCGYYDTFIKLYSSAKYVVTNRIHTSLICMVYGVSFKYLGNDAANSHEGSGGGEETSFIRYNRHRERRMVNKRKNLFGGLFEIYRAFNRIGEAEYD
jgi:hypothetical protein